MKSPPRAARTGQYVNRSVLSSGPTMRPGRTMVQLEPYTLLTACSQSAFNGP